MYIPILTIMIVDNVLLYFAHNDGNDNGTGHSPNNSDIERDIRESKKRARCEAMEKRDDGGRGGEHV